MLGTSIGLRPCPVVRDGGAAVGGRQVPQYLLEAAAAAGRGGACSVVCTQPRRLAATSVAERVADERGEPAPGRPGARVRRLYCVGSCRKRPSCHGRRSSAAVCPQQRRSHQKQGKEIRAEGRDLSCWHSDLVCTRTHGVSPCIAAWLLFRLSKLHVQCWEVPTASRRLLQRL